MVGAGAPYGILGQALRRLCGLCGSEPEAVQQQALADRIGGVAGAEQRTRLIAFLGELCGICFSDDGSGRLLSAREDPRLMRDQIRRAFLDWLHLESERAPVLLILDDLHWGDGLSVGQENLLKGLSKKASERLVQLGGVAALLGLPSHAPELGQWLGELVDLEMIDPHAESRLAEERVWLSARAASRCGLLAARRQGCRDGPPPGQPVSLRLRSRKVSLGITSVVSSERAGWSKWESAFMSHLSPLPARSTSCIF